MINQIFFSSFENGQFFGELVPQVLDGLLVGGLLLLVNCFLLRLLLLRLLVLLEVLLHQFLPQVAELQLLTVGQLRLTPLFAFTCVLGHHHLLQVVHHFLHAQLFIGQRA